MKIAKCKANILVATCKL